MKILLIEPTKSPVAIGGEDFFMHEPLALEYVAAGVAADQDVRILDMRIEPDLAGAMAGFAPDIVGLTAYTVQVHSVLALARMIKALAPSVLTVVGGHHATVQPQDFVDPAIDLIVQGEGVTAFAEIVRRRAAGESFAGIPSVRRAQAGELDAALPHVLSDLDTLPFPQRRLTAKYRQHYFAEWMKPLASIRTSTGCPFRCNFCALWKLTGGRYLSRRPEEIVRELAGIEEECVFFADDESLVQAGRMMELARHIKAAGLRKRYFLYGRSDTIRRHPELVEAWKTIGLERVFVGLEFFRSEDLRWVNKGTTVADNAAAVQILRELGIEIYASFMVRPEFTRKDFREVRRYCRDLRLNFATFSVLTPLPGTDLYAAVHDRLLTHDYGYFDFAHTLLPTTLPLRDFYREFAGLYERAIPLRRKIVFIRRFQPRDVFPMVRSGRRVIRRMRQAYRDYDDGRPRDSA